MPDKPFRYWLDAWNKALRWKKPADRRAALEPLLKAPWEVVRKIVAKSRKLISVDEPEIDSSNSYFLARQRKRNVLKDAVHIDAYFTKRRVRTERILVCHEIVFARIPRGRLWIHESVLAAAGTVGGERVVNFNEYLGCGTEFPPEIEADFPRLQKYQSWGNTVRCIWSTRGLKLKQWQQRLNASDGLKESLEALAEKFSFTDMTKEVEKAVQEALMPMLAPLRSHADPAIQLLARRAWNMIIHDQPGVFSLPPALYNELRAAGKLA